MKFDFQPQPLVYFGHMQRICGEDIPTVQGPSRRTIEPYRNARDDLVD